MDKAGHAETSTQEVDGSMGWVVDARSDAESRLTQYVDAGHQHQCPCGHRFIPEDTPQELITANIRAGIHVGFDRFVADEWTCFRRASP